MSAINRPDTGQTIWQFNVCCQCAQRLPLSGSRQPDICRRRAPDNPTSAVDGPDNPTFAAVGLLTTRRLPSMAPTTRRLPSVAPTTRRLPSSGSRQPDVCRRRPRQPDVCRRRAPDERQCRFCRGPNFTGKTTQMLSSITESFKEAFMTF
jgi:hypothetical protein